MPKIYCLFWVGGSGGDLIQQLLIQSGQFENSTHAHINEQGRVKPRIDSRLLELFPPDDMGWYNRSWSLQDLETLSNLANSSHRPWLVGTHSLAQLNLFKQYLSAATVGITYSNQLYPAVIKNWCKKSAADSQPYEKLYSQSHPLVMEKFKQQGLWPEFMLKEILRYIDNIPKFVPATFDINIELGKIYNGDLADIDDFVNSNTKNIFDPWLSLQDPLYQCCFPHDSAYAEVLGYNDYATTPAVDPIPLSSLDQILINHWCQTNKKSKPKNCMTHVDLINFLQGIQ